jgi:glycosyltransferase involved in cell wall biosynthesis
MKKVLILKRYDREFRKPLYDLLGAKLEAHNIRLEIIYGQPDKWEEQTIKDLIRPHKWGMFVRNRYLGNGKKAACWQPVMKYTRDADLVIVQQGNRELVNYVLMLRRIFRKRPAFTFWGHGMNFQAKSAGSLKERWKSLYSSFADHWFAYNELSRQVMTDKGFDPDRVTALQNTIETRDETATYDSISEKELDELRSKLGIGINSIVGIYCGSLYPEKRIDFLIKALLSVKSHLTDFHFLILGDGILRQQVLDMITGHESWIHYAGPKFGKNRLPYFKLASFQLIPGLVGLNIIDSFITLTPLITTENKLHSPEISYMVNYENGIMTGNSLEEYAHAIVKFVSDPHLQVTLIQGCVKAREQYTIEHMSNNYFRGIMKVLEQN